MNTNPCPTAASNPPCNAPTPAVPHRQKRRDDQRPGHGRLHLLIVDDEPDVLDAIGAALPGDDLRISPAHDFDQARRLSADDPVDLALIDIKLPDGSGLDLAEELAGRQPACQIIMMTGAPSSTATVQAMRAGARDFLAKPIDPDELNRRLRSAIQRRQRLARRGRRVRRLRRLARQLDHDRRDISEQLDILCKDLVGAYQDMAAQMQLMEKVGEFKAILREELDLEQALRLCLQFMLDQIGPTNAAIFLPGSTGGYAVGGYVNYSNDCDNPHLLLDHLADILAPRIADEPEVCHLADNELIAAWLGDDAPWLEDCHLLAVPCRDDQQTMAAILLYRDADQPFHDDHLKLLNHIAPFFGKHLARLVRVHHRLNRFFDEDEPWKSTGEPWESPDDDDDPLGV